MDITTDDLYEFGKWARHNPDELRAKSQWQEMIMKDNVEQKTDIRYKMTDEKADKIDKAACALCHYSEQLGEMFYQHYVCRASYRALAEEYQVPRNQVAKQLNEASGFVIGVAVSA